MLTRIAPLIITLLCFPSGCVAPNGGPLFGLHWPELGNPGTMQQQRNNAALNDPYADAYAGPAFDGARPREFAKPLAEPVRNRLIYEQGPRR